jgi:hypothetical protein
VVLQERGGDFTCNFGPDACKSARNALSTLVNGVRRHGAKPLLLGTYEAIPEASEELVAAESKVARANHIGYVSVSEELRRARTALPEAKWFASDGMHPGHDLTLLDALLLYRRIYGAHPARNGFRVAAPIYTPKSGLTPELRAATAPAPQDGTATLTAYDSGEVAGLAKQLQQPVLSHEIAAGPLRR